ncbi:FkbM family methyltransferase [Paenibacillus sp. CAU 1782]
MHKIIMDGSGHAMYVNSGDQRGGRMIRHKGSSQPRVTAFWRNAVAAIKPTLIVDAGVNYGEIILSAVYPKETSIAVIEANENLRPYLERSLGEHPNSGQISVYFAFVSDTGQKAIPFYVDKRHSGLSSGHAPAPNTATKKEVRTVAIDDLFGPEKMKDSRLLFKMDVEGFEWEAINGMSTLLSSCREAAGIIEFNLPYMIKKGIDVEEFVGLLEQRFLLFAPDKHGRLIEMKGSAYQSILSFFAANKECNDLVLLSNRSLLDKLQPSQS